MSLSATFSACEALINKHAPMLMRISEADEPKAIRIPCAWKPPVPNKTIRQMQTLRRNGVTIGDIARQCRVSWRTAWKHSALIK